MLMAAIAGIGVLEAFGIAAAIAAIYGAGVASTFKGLHSGSMSVDQVSAEEAAAIIDVIRENQGSPFVSSTADSLSEGMSFGDDVEEQDEHQELQDLIDTARENGDENTALLLERIQDQLSRTGLGQEYELETSQVLSAIGNLEGSEVTSIVLDRLGENVSTDTDLAVVEQSQNLALYTDLIFQPEFADADMGILSADVINFNSKTDGYGWLSNFGNSPMCGGDNKQYPTAEHAYQASKTTDLAFRERIRTAYSAAQARVIGRNAPLRADWGSIKNGVMKRILEAKFAQNPGLADKLLGTGNNVLMHEAPWDSYWGSGKTGNGQNIMGQMLMEIRESLRKGSSLPGDGDPTNCPKPKKVYTGKDSWKNNVRYADKE